MKEEIKEILDDLRKTADNTFFIVWGSQEELDKAPRYTANFLSINDRQAKLLLDYITTLQEENKEAHDFDKTMKDIKDNLIARINRQETEIERLKQELFDFKQNIYIEKAEIPQKLTQNKSFMELYDIPTYEDYKLRIDKAIEYINTLDYENEETYDIGEYVRNELLEILEGSGKE